MKTKKFPWFSFNACLALLVTGIGGLSAYAFEDSEDTIPKLAPPAPAKVTTELTRRVHTVKLGREGLVPGRIAITHPQDGQTHVVKDVRVHFVRNGEPVAVVEPGVNGVFQAEGISPGEYAVVAVGPQVVSAFAVNVIDGDIDGVPVDATLQLQSQGIQSGDFPAIASLMDSYVTSDFCARFCGGAAPAASTICPTCDPAVPAIPAGGVIHQPVPVPAGGVVIPSASVEAPAKYAFTAAQDDDADDSEEDVEEEEEDSEPGETVGDNIRARPVRLATGGKVGGRIAWATTTAPFQKAASDAVVAFVRDGKVEKMARTNSTGAFEVTGLSHGTYSVFTSCQSDCGAQSIDSGCSCFSVDCLPPLETPIVDDPCCSQIDTCLVGCSNMDYTADQICGSLCGGGVGTPGGGGGFGGGMSPYGFGGGYGYGGFGGGGFGGGGGGFGGFGGFDLFGALVPGAIGWGIAEAINDDDGGAPVTGDATPGS